MVKRAVRLGAAKLGSFCAGESLAVVTRPSAKTLSVRPGTVTRFIWLALARFVRADHINRRGNREVALC